MGDEVHFPPSYLNSDVLMLNHNPHDAQGPWPADLPGKTDHSHMGNVVPLPINSLLTCVLAS